MLVFTRKVDEAIIVGDGIEIKVLRVGTDGVRLGVSAPPSVPIHRREIYDQIKAANAAAAAKRSAVGDLVARLKLKAPPSEPESGS